MFIAAESHKRSVTDMSKKINLRPLTGIIKAIVDTVFEAYRSAVEKIRANKRLCWTLRLLARYLICGLALVVYTIVVSRYAQKQALKTYEGWFEAYKIEQAEAEAMRKDGEKKGEEEKR